MQIVRPSTCYDFQREKENSGAYGYKPWNSDNDVAKCLPSKQKIFVWHLYNVRPTSKTLGRSCINVIQIFCVCWARLLGRPNHISPGLGVVRILTDLLWLNRHPSQLTMWVASDPAKGGMGSLALMAGRLTRMRVFANSTYRNRPSFWFHFSLV